MLCKTAWWNRKHLKMFTLIGHNAQAWNAYILITICISHTVTVFHGLMDFNCKTMFDSQALLQSWPFFILSSWKKTESKGQHRYRLQLGHMQYSQATACSAVTVKIVSYFYGTAFARTASKWPSFWRPVLNPFRPTGTFLPPKYSF